jgi:NDP-sugar pyrophosphorylase family protein
VTNIFTHTVVQHLPIVENDQIIDLIIKSKWFIDSGYGKESRQLNAPVVIMAGGKGTRLEPFTSILPKPLIPIGEKPIIEIIMAEYAKYGLHKFYLSVNYKAKMIKAYFEDATKNYSIEYIDENVPLGTAGSLKLIEHSINHPFFVSNCDVLIKDQYDKIYDFHINGSYELTLVASMQNHTLPYGVCEIETGGRLKAIKEKPNFDFLANSGMYILNPSVFRYIPSNTFYNMTDLINDLLKNGYSVGVYPVSENSYMDFGQWSEFKKSLKSLGAGE